MLSPIQRLDAALLDAVTERALTSARRRVNHNFHASDTENPHRFLNALVEGTYCQPHRHSQPPKSESFLVLRGRVAIFVFDGTGKVIETHVLGDDGLLGVDVPPGVWHSITALSPTAVCYEVKPGPWDPATDKEFAPWAPSEDSPAAAEYLRALVATAQPSLKP
jgi:cupin fold WbuC family metalloprotein